MAYSGALLSLMVGSVEGSFNIFVYQSQDDIGTVLDSNYFSDGFERGMQIGDFVFAVCSGVPYLLYVESQNGSAFTANTMSLALINGNALPVTNPGPGTGLLWNNAGFVCVA